MSDTWSAYHRALPAGSPQRLVLVFVDGLGLAPAGESNPLAATATPTLEALLGGPLTREQVGRAASGAALAALDATLGVDGLPQSATGQTTLLTGINAAAAMGRHVSAFPGPRLRRLLRDHGLLGRLRRAGLEVTFANAYSRSYLEDLASGRARRSVTTCLMEYAGLGFRAEAELAAGRAVTWEITGERFAARTGLGTAEVTAEEAGERLAAIAASHHFTLFETFLTDLAGHGRRGVSAAEAVGRVDGLLGGLVRHAPAEATILLTSDHGNLEDSSDRVHTRNPVPLLAIGPAAKRFARLRSIADLAQAVVSCLGAGPEGRQSDATGAPT